MQTLLAKKPEKRLHFCDRTDGMTASFSRSTLRKILKLLGGERYIKDFRKARKADIAAAIIKKVETSRKLRMSNLDKAIRVSRYTSYLRPTPQEGFVRIVQGK